MGLITINEKIELRNIILSGQFDDSIQVKNNEHICKDGTIYDYSSITNVNSMFADIESLNNIPLFDTSNVDSFYCMFSCCFSLTSVPLLDMSRATNSCYMFNNCSSLKNIPLLNTSNILYNTSMFFGCSSLHNLPSLDFFNVKSLSDSIFNGCSNLDNRDKLLILSKKTNDNIFKKYIFSKDISKNKIDKMLLEYI
jgi:hypothetical protein